MKRLLLTLRRRTLGLHLLLALSLLIAQSLAQAHVYSHYKNVTEQSDFTGTAGQLCSQCLSSAPLLGAAGSPDSPRLICVDAVVVIVATAPAPRFSSAYHFGFRSRAPPELV